MQRWKCGSCDYRYNPQRGDPLHRVKPGTGFEQIPDTWVCPVCGAPKREFRPA